MATFPVRLFGYGRKTTIRLPANMGGSAKIWLRNVAKRLPEYSAAIECPVQGQADNGDIIPINTVGRWLFGTPGYAGHIRVINWEGVDAQVEWPQGSPQEVEALISKLKEEVERGLYERL